jgi:hypothetical protein
MGRSVALVVVKVRGARTALIERAEVRCLRVHHGGWPWTEDLPGFRRPVPEQVAPTLNLKSPQVPRIVAMAGVKSVCARLP